jgi:TatD DNase family protein
MWFDSHCHLHLCETGSPEEVVTRARGEGVTQMLTVGIDVDSSEIAASLTTHEGVFASVGVHPNSADEWDAGARARVKELATGDGVVAIGESGLDFYRDNVEPDVQRSAFEDHIDLCKELDKTLVIHTRSSIEEALEVLAKAGPPSRFIFHCWSGDLEQLSRAVALGAFISFAGNVSFKSAGDLRAAAAAVPVDRLLIETDSPFLTPVPDRGKPNEPRLVVSVGAAVAEARGVSVEDIAALTQTNATRAFGL